MTDPSARTGPRVLAGRYVLEQRLGVGGTGAVWRASDRRLERTVAVKILDVDMARDPDTRARLRTEAAAAAKLSHAHAVTVFDIGHDDGDYLVMELVDGGTLEDVLGHGPATAEVVATLGAQVGDALGAAHARGIVHRDVKPANILLTVDGVPKVADFGIARALGEATSRLTAPGQIVGTARYLAPEQLREGQPDARTDVYALGLVLHQLLTGRPPFGDGTPAEVALRRLTDPLPRASELRPGIPSALDNAVERATRLEPAERFVDGRALARALRGLADPKSTRELAARITPSPARPRDEPTISDERTGLAAAAAAADEGDSTTPLGRAEPVTAASVAETSTAPRRRWRWALAVVAVALVGGAVALVTGDGSQPQQPPEDEGGDTDQVGGADQSTVEIVDGDDHDPFGSGEEHGEDVPNAYDGDPATVWQTQGYIGDPQLGGLKPGVGVWFELSEEQPITQVVVTTTNPGASLTLFAGPAPPSPGAAPDDWGTRAASVNDAGEETRIDLDEPVEGRVWLLWFTSLPPDGGRFRATVADVRFVGP